MDIIHRNGGKYRSLSSPSTTVVKFQKRSDNFNCCLSHNRHLFTILSKELKAWPNDRNIVGRNMLRAFGLRVATCWVLLAQV